MHTSFRSNAVRPVALKARTLPDMDSNITPCHPIHSTPSDLVSLSGSGPCMFGNEDVAIDPLMTIPIIEMPETVPNMVVWDLTQLSDVSELRNSSVSPACATAQSVAKYRITPRFRDAQAEQWSQKFEELCAFRQSYSHCSVPHTHENRALVRWVKRQRYQYKLLLKGLPSTMTFARASVLTKAGFVWDSQNDSWYERFEELKQFKSEHGHFNVSSRCPKHRKLATWVKSQRRQYKLFQSGHQSHITADRIATLEKEGFVWGLRRVRSSCTDPR